MLLYLCCLPKANLSSKIFLKFSFQAIHQQRQCLYPSDRQEKCLGMAVIIKSKKVCLNYNKMEIPFIIKLLSPSLFAQLTTATIWLSLAQLSSSLFYFFSGLSIGKLIWM